eukprot:635550-Pelagomonas_calceolata.AAC.3
MRKARHETHVFTGTQKCQMLQTEPDDGVGRQAAFAQSLIKQAIGLIHFSEMCLAAATLLTRVRNLKKTGKLPKSIKRTLNKYPFYRQAVNIN